MNHCETCKHWDRATGHNYLVDEWARVGLVWADHGDCGMARNNYEDYNSPRPRETLAWAEDGESYRAGLTTHKTFGCVQWQAKV